ncbi:MAG: hypothetical protein ACJ74W_19330 [Pyrinomonadaceae bacterium]
MARCQRGQPAPGKWIFIQPLVTTIQPPVTAHYKHAAALPDHLTESLRAPTSGSGLAACANLRCGGVAEWNCW